MRVDDELKHCNTRMLSVLPLPFCAKRARDQITAQMELQRKHTHTLTHAYAVRARFRIDGRLPLLHTQTWRKS